MIASGRRLEEGFEFPRAGLAQDGFQFGEEMLERVEVGAEWGR